MINWMLFLFFCFMVGRAVIYAYRWIFPKKRVDTITHEPGTDVLGREVIYMKFGEDEDITPTI